MMQDCGQPGFTLAERRRFGAILKECVIRKYLLPSFCIEISIVKLSPASKWLFHETEVSRREKRKKKWSSNLFQQFPCLQFFPAFSGKRKAGSSFSIISIAALPLFSWSRGFIGHGFMNNSFFFFFPSCWPQSHEKAICSQVIISQY